jgi:hypothetical protein
MGDIQLFESGCACQGICISRCWLGDDIDDTPGNGVTCKGIIYSNRCVDCMVLRSHGQCRRTKGKATAIYRRRAKSEGDGTGGGYI